MTILLSQFFLDQFVRVIQLYLRQFNLHRASPHKYSYGDTRFNEPLYNEVLGITNYFLNPKKSKIYKKPSRYNELKPRYSEQILPVS